MKAHDLFRLGRQLAKLAEEAMRGSTAAPATPPGMRLVLMDVAAEPGSSIGQIAARTGLPQSYVSESVARFRAQKAMQTWSDPTDGRRTLVKISAATSRSVARVGAVPVDDTLLAAAGTGDPKADAALIATLDALAARLNQPG